MAARFSITNAARYLALLASMAISYTVERTLALTHGVPHAASFAVPVAIDLFMVWAVRTGRDVFLSVSVAVLANVAGVLTSADLGRADTWVSVALHAAFPLIVWRMHRRPHSLAEPSTAPAAPAGDSDSAEGPQNGSPAVADEVWQEFDDAASRPAPAEPAVTARPDASAIRGAVSALTAEGRTVTGRTLAQHFGVSDRTGRRYLAMATA